MIEAYHTAYAKYTRDCTKLLDWIEPNREMKEKARQDFMNTNCVNKLYSQTHWGHQIADPKEPQFSAFYQPSEQKQDKLLFVGSSALACSYAALPFL